MPFSGTQQAYKKRTKSTIPVSTCRKSGIKLIPEQPRRHFQKNRFTAFIAAHTAKPLRDTRTPDDVMAGVSMDQEARCDAKNHSVQSFTGLCSPAVFARWSALSTQMESALAGIANYYGRQKLAPYPHEPKAWSDVRAALLAASDFRQTHGLASGASHRTDPSQTKPGMANQ